MRILEASTLREIKRLMRGIKVDSYGINIMAPKGINRLIRLNSISNIAANILKQQMLSLGGDVAVSRSSLTGKTATTDCFIIGNISQIKRLNLKLNRQPFGLSRVSREITCVLNNYQRENFELKLGSFKLKLGPRTAVMGIINATPDSFSGDGIYRASMCQGISLSEIIEHAQRLVRDGAEILDIGGESSRPGARPVSTKEELSRVIPVVKALAKKVKAPISIDTYKQEVARAALDCGACLINDITGFTDRKMLKIAAQYRAAVVIMHMKGKPHSMQQAPRYECLISEILDFLKTRVNKALEAGIESEKIIIDPGIGFGKTIHHNLEILKHLKEFKIFGKPILVGPSRKSFIGKILKTGTEDRLAGSLSSICLAAKNGARIIRAHDVKEAVQALKISDAINNA